MRIGIEYCPDHSIDHVEADFEDIKRLGYDAIDFQAFCHTENIFYQGSVADMEKLLKRVRLSK